MAARESLREVENLRFRFQMNNRLRLECLAAVSKMFREFGEPISDELLSAIVFALPEELVSSNAGRLATAEQVAALPPERPGQPGLPPNQPGTPDRWDQPGEDPARLPPESPALPPESPSQPALPPEQANRVASDYVA